MGSLMALAIELMAILNYMRDMNRVLPHIVLDGKPVNHIQDHPILTLPVENLKPAGAD